MTDQLFDDRAAAYVGAREAIKAATAIKVRARRAAIADPDNGGFKPIALSDEYWALMAEGAILADLARCDAGVGMIAGNYLADQAQRVDRSKRRRIRGDVREKLDEVRRRSELHTDPFDLQGAGQARPIRVTVTSEGRFQHRTGIILENKLEAGQPITYKVALDPDPADDWRPRSAEHEWFGRDDLELVGN